MSDNKKPGITKFRSVYNNTDSFPSLEDIGEHFGVHSNTIIRWARTFRNSGYRLKDRSDQGKSAKEKIINAYAKLVKRKRMHPSQDELKSSGLNKYSIERHFGSIMGLIEQVRNEHPEVFDGVVDEEIFKPAEFKRLKQEAQKYKRFVVTTAVTGCEAHLGFLKSLKSYCKKNDALLLILPASDPASLAGFSLDPELSEEYIVFDDLSLCKTLFISSIKLSAKHIDPITGLERIGQRDGSFIYASPKQRLKLVANSEKYPCSLMTTGAITVPNYKTDRYMSGRTAYIADHDHVMGAIIVELEDNDKRFHFRQIQAEASGSFVDLGKYYQGNRVSTLRPEAFIMGDLHVGAHDPQVVGNWIECIKQLKPKKLLIHDTLSGHSICHHDSKKRITMALKFHNGQLSLLRELKDVASMLDQLSELVEDIIIVKSNHDEWINQYLESGEYVKDPQNHRIALKLALAMLSGKDPFKYGVEKFGDLQNKCKVKWLQREEDYRISGIQCASHGDKGLNGKRNASPRELEKAYGRSFSGHTHVPEILRGVWVVGTSTYLRVGYNNDSPSSWFNTSGLVYPNGSRQMINSLGGKWKRD